MDEIGDMPQPMQAKLLRVLENGEVVRLGSNDPVRVDVRFISATNRNIEEMVAEKHFREDLYFRIKGMTIHLPPLRERREDIPLLVHYFLRQAAHRNHKTIEGLRPEVQQVLMSYSWPGNVRQLKTVVENMVVMAPEHEKIIGLEGLPSEIRPAGAEAAAGMDNLVGMSITQAEKELIRNTLKMVNGNREQAAKILGIGERTGLTLSQDQGVRTVKKAAGPSFRIGHGYDLHRLKRGGRLLLGGVLVSKQFSPVSHSDGDVVIHAVVDALLGAMGWGDIGEHFPNTDPQWKGAASRIFLERVWARVHRSGYRLGNLDITIIAERPKLKEYKQAIAESLRRLMGDERATVNIKAGTNEGCDAIGRGEAIAAHAVDFALTRFDR